MDNTKEVKSETVAEVGKIKGKVMGIERIDHMPFHERRGRKPRNKADG